MYHSWRGAEHSNKLWRRNTPSVLMLKWSSFLIIAVFVCSVRVCWCCMLDKAQSRAHMVLLMRAGLSPCANLQGPSGFGQRSALLNTSENEKRNRLQCSVYKWERHAGPGLKRFFSTQEHSRRIVCFVLIFMMLYGSSCEVRWGFLILPEQIALFSSFLSVLSSYVQLN